MGDIDSSIERSKPRPSDELSEPTPPAMSGAGGLAEPKDCAASELESSTSSSKSSSISEISSISSSRSAAAAVPVLTGASDSFGPLASRLGAAAARGEHDDGMPASPASLLSMASSLRSSSSCCSPPGDPPPPAGAPRPPSDGKSPSMVPPGPGLLSDGRSRSVEFAPTRSRAGDLLLGADALAGEDALAAAAAAIAAGCGAPPPFRCMRTSCAKSGSSPAASSPSDPARAWRSGSSRSVRPASGSSTASE